MQPNGNYNNLNYTSLFPGVWHYRLMHFQCNREFAFIETNIYLLKAIYKMCMTIKVSFISIKREQSGNQNVVNVKLDVCRVCNLVLQYPKVVKETQSATVYTREYFEVSITNKNVSTPAIKVMRMCLALPSDTIEQKEN